MTRTAATNVIVSWTAPVSVPALGGYEVFYQTAAGSNGSSTTTTTELTLTGLMLGQTYSIFVVAFGTEGAPVLPSAHSNTEMITLSEFSTEFMISSNSMVCAVHSYSTTYWCHTHPHNLLHHGVMDSSTVYYS